MTTITLPEGFVSVDASLPIEDRPVVAIRKAGYISATLEVVTARYQPSYRRLAPWRDLGGDAITDSGSKVLGWRYADDWLQFKG